MDIGAWQATVQMITNSYLFRDSTSQNYFLINTTIFFTLILPQWTGVFHGNLTCNIATE